MALYDALSLRKCCALASKCRREILCRAASETPVAEDPLLRPLQTSPPQDSTVVISASFPFTLAAGVRTADQSLRSANRQSFHNVTAPCAAATGRSGYTATEETENPVALQQ